MDRPLSEQRRLTVIDQCRQVRASRRLSQLSSVCDVQPSADLQAAVERLAGSRPLRWTLRSGGFTPSERWSFDLADGRRVFAKRATRDWLAETLRDEHRILAMVEPGLRCEVLGWDDSERPVLMLEDLSHGYWPPPWRPGDVARVLAALEQMWVMPALELPSAETLRPVMTGWSQITADSSGFLQLRIATRPWLERCLEPLRDAADASSLTGDAFMHMDIRSDNICLLDDRVVFVDWNWAVRGPRELDIACWLPSLWLEGGAVPEGVPPEAGSYAAAIASFFAVQAALPPVPDSPRLRGFQLDQLKVALPWACRELGLPPPDLLPDA